MMVPSRHDLTPGETGTVAGMPLSLWELVGLHAMSLQVLSHPLPPPPSPKHPHFEQGMMTSWGRHRAPGDVSFINGAVGMGGHGQGIEKHVGERRLALG